MICKGDIIYYIANGNRIVPAKVIGISGNLYTLKTNSGGLRLPMGRLFENEHEAKQAILPKPKPPYRNW